MFDFQADNHMVKTVSMTGGARAITINNGGEISTRYLRTRNER